MVPVNKLHRMKAAMECEGVQPIALKFFDWVVANSVDETKNYVLLVVCA